MDMSVPLSSFKQESGYPVRDKVLDIPIACNASSFSSNGTEDLTGLACVLRAPVPPPSRKPLLKPAGICCLEECIPRSVRCFSLTRCICELRLHHEAPVLVIDIAELCKFYAVVMQEDALCASNLVHHKVHITR